MTDPTIQQKTCTRCYKPLTHSELRLNRTQCRKCEKTRGRIRALPTMRPTLGICPLIEVFCRFCCKIKPVSEFYWQKANSTYGYQCKKCRRIKMQEWEGKSNTPEARLLAQRKYRESIKGRIKIAKHAASPENREKQRLRNRRSIFKRLYQMDLEDYDAMLQAQQGVCAICQQPPTGLHLCVDHCHATGQVRGLLCKKCNTAIGQLRDSPTLLRHALAYLEKHQQLRLVV